MTTKTIQTEDEARGVLLEDQLAHGCIPTAPASADTQETERGWAFFNVNGYLGTVTPKGEVIEEPEYADEDDD